MDIKGKEKIKKAIKVSSRVLRIFFAIIFGVIKFAGICIGVSLMLFFGFPVILIGFILELANLTDHYDIEDAYMNFWSRLGNWWIELGKYSKD